MLETNSEIISSHKQISTHQTPQSPTMKHLIPITIFVLPTVLAQTCDRPALQAIATAYTLSQSQGSLTPLTPYLPTDLTTVAYTENAKPATLAASILATQPLVLAHNRSTLDTAQCATYTELIVTDAKHPYVIGTQIRVAPTGSANLTVGNIETLVTDKGDWLFNASGTYAWAIKENWGVIEEEKRNKRDVIRAAADACVCSPSRSLPNPPCPLSPHNGPSGFCFTLPGTKRTNGV